MSHARESLLLGRLAVHYELISEDQLAEATRQQARQGGQPPLGDLFLAHGWINQRQLDRLLAVQREYLHRADPQEPSPAAPRGPAPSPVPSPDPTEALPPGLAALLRLAVERGASDLHLHAGLPVRLRRLGALEEAGEPLAPPEAARWVDALLDERLRRELAERGQVDFAFSLPGLARFRANAFRQQRGTNAVFRIVAPVPPRLDDLGLPADLARLTNYAQGMVLVTGPAGCGKSSTLAALVRLINEERREHVIAIEDPIEFVHPPGRSVVNQRQAGRDTAGFARALRAALREDPDVIAIGELRDLETISLALTAAETGHLVLGTLHTGSAIRTVDRLVGVFPPTQQSQVRAMLSESLRAVLSQRLLRRADGGGRVAALEVLLGTRAVANLIRENKTFQIRSLMQTGAALGMCLLDQSLAALVRAGTVSRAEALLHAEDPRQLPA